MDFLFGAGNECVPVRSFASDSYIVHTLYTQKKKKKKNTTMKKKKTEKRKKKAQKKMKKAFVFATDAQSYSVRY